MSSTSKDKDTQYKKIIIKYNEKENSRYSFKIYNKNPFLKSYITKEKFRDILDQANIIVYDSKIKKAKFDKIHINKYINILFVLAIFLILTYTFLLFFMPGDGSLHNQFITFGVVCFFISVILLLIIEGNNSLRKVEGNKTLYEFFRDDMIKYMEKLNNEYREAMIFKFDKINKDIICYVKLQQRDMNINNNKKWGDTIPKTNDI